MFERIFKLSEHKTTVKTEVMAGITTFIKKKEIGKLHREYMDLI